MTKDLESICINLKLSQKLKNLNINQESLFWWVYIDKEWIVACRDGDFAYLSPKLDKDLSSAFTASELLELLPNSIDIKQNEPFNNFRFNMMRSLIVETDMLNPDRVFLLNYNCDTFKLENCAIPIMDLLPHNIWDKSLSNALAKLLIYLIENNLIKIS